MSMLALFGVNISKFLYGFHMWNIILKFIKHLDGAGEIAEGEAEK